MSITHHPRTVFICSIFVILSLLSPCHGYLWEELDGDEQRLYSTENGSAFTYYNTSTRAMGARTKAYEPSPGIGSPFTEWDTSNSDAFVTKRMTLTVTEEERIYFNIIHHGTIDSFGERLYAQSYFNVHFMAPSHDNDLSISDYVFYEVPDPDFWWIPPHGQSRFAYSGGGDPTSHTISEESFEQGTYYGDRWFDVLFEPGVYKVDYNIRNTVWVEGWYEDQFPGRDQYWAEAYFPLIGNLPNDGMPSSDAGDYGAYLNLSSQNPGEALILESFIIPEPFTAMLLTLGIVGVISRRSGRIRSQ